MALTLADIQKKYGESVYPLYKDQMHEPYMESTTGYSPQGVVLHDETNDKIMCGECGKWFDYLPSHIRIHKMNASEYKVYYGLTQNIPLCSKKHSLAISENAVNNNFQTRLSSHGFTLKARRMANVFKPRQSAIFKNKHGLCEAQVIARLLITFNQSGELSRRMVKKCDKRLYGYITYNLDKDKSWEYYFNYLRGQGIESKGKYKSYTDAELIGKLRNYVLRTGFIPKTNPRARQTWPNELPPYSTFQNYFGSWRRAKMMAGLDQLVSESNVLPSSPKLISSFNIPTT